MKQVLLSIFSSLTLLLTGIPVIAVSHTISVVQQDSAKQREIKEAATRKEAEEENLKKEKDKAKTRDPHEAAYHDAVAIIETPISGYTLDNIEPSDRMKGEFDKKIEQLQKFPDLKVKITGHTCDRGSEDVNKQIAQKRADAAKAYFISKGINQKRITTDSKGKEEPIEPNTNNTNRLKNRRVEFQVN